VLVARVALMDMVGVALIAMTVFGVALQALLILKKLRHLLPYRGDLLAQP